MLSVGGVAVALVLVLVLQGIFAGAMAQVTRYLDRLPADVIVSQRGVRTMHMSTSALPMSTVDAVQAQSGVAWSESIRFATGVVAGPTGGRQLAYLIGFEPTAGRAGPGRLIAGRPPGPGEGVLDELGADQLGVGVGDTVSVYGIDVRVSGLSSGGTSITNTTLFVRFEDMAALQPRSVSYVVVGAEAGVSDSELRDRLADAMPDVTVQTRAEFERSEARIVSDMSADVMRIMNVIGLGIALAVIALSLYTLTLAKAREYGVIRGHHGRRRCRRRPRPADRRDRARTPGCRRHRPCCSRRRRGRRAGPAVPDRRCRSRLGIPEALMITTVRVRGLTKTFGEGNRAVTAVGAVDLDLERGEVVLVMGPSGSGKTTLLLMLGAMLRPTAGAIEVGGVDLARAPERDLPLLRAGHFGFIFQDFNLLGALDATENVELAANLGGVTGRRARERATTLLTNVGLAHRLRHRPDQLSGGEKQRVAIARALANDPALILADEPTANLDSSIGRDVARLLRRLATDEGRTVVIVSHDDRLREIADRVLWLEDGHFREIDAMVADPVCGMTVDRNPDLALSREGETWWFCSTHCRDEFSLDPVT